MFQGMKYVYEVYKEKSFSKAAASLFISQPSVSCKGFVLRSKIGEPMRFSIRFTFALKEGCEIKRLAAAFEKLFSLYTGH